MTGISNKERGLPDGPAWATEPPVWGEPIGYPHLLDQVQAIDRKKPYRFAYPDGANYETEFTSEAAARAWARINGHGYLGEVKAKPIVGTTPRAIENRGTEPALSPPPLVQALVKRDNPRPKPKPKPNQTKKSDETPSVSAIRPDPKDQAAEELRTVRKDINKLRPELEKSRHEAKSKMLDAIPVLGFAAAAVYDVIVADDPGSAALGIAKEGLEKSIDKTVEHAADKELPPGWTGPKKAWDLHKAMREHGENSQKMDELLEKRYRLMDRLGMPDARYDLPGTNFYLGPNGALYDKRTGQLAPRY